MNCNQQERNAMKRSGEFTNKNMKLIATVIPTITHVSQLAEETIPAGNI
jgi:hypothetical protein